MRVIIDKSELPKLLFCKEEEYNHTGRYLRSESTYSIFEVISWILPNKVKRFYYEIRYRVEDINWRFILVSTLLLSLIIFNILLLIYSLLWSK